jgi:starch synthase
MDILFITPEIAGYGAEGPTAEAIAALPKALRGHGHRVTVVTPLWSGIDPQRRGLARRLMTVDVEIDGDKVPCELYDGRTTGGVDLLFIGHPELFGGAENMTDGDDQRVVAERAAVFARAVLGAADKYDGSFGAIHAHDWPGALAIAFAKQDSGLADVPAILTIHDPSAQGELAGKDAKALGLSKKDAKIAEAGGRTNVLALGLERADHVTTVSPTYARELAAAPNGAGLEERYGALGDKLVGILNGVDSSVWNPATDPRVQSRFDPMDLAGKARNKTHLQRAEGFPVRDDVPLLVLLATSDPSSGFDLFVEIAPKVLRNDCQILVVFDGDESDPLRAKLEELSDRWPDRLKVEGHGDGGITHEALAAADLVLVPSRHEPCGFVQMVAHRYGALPVVRRTGGLADTVVDCDAALETGTGFVFDEATSEDLLAAIRRSFSAFQKVEEIDALKRRVMRLDHSWERSARLYERLYRGGSIPEELS